MSEVVGTLLGMEIGNKGRLRLQGLRYLPGFKVEGNMIDFTRQGGFNAGAVVEVLDVEVTNRRQDGGKFLKKEGHVDVFYIQPSQIPSIVGLEPLEIN